MPESVSRRIASIAALLATETSSSEPWREALEGFVERARRAYPDLAVPTPASVVACLRSAGAGEPAELRDLDAGEVWLSAACADADPEAVAAFEREYVARLSPALLSMDLTSEEIEDVQQRVRQRLLTAEPGQPLRLFQYAGRGRLFGLVKVVAIRIALDDLRRRKRAPDRAAAHDATVARLMDGGLGPELALVEAQHRDAVKSAFGSAVESLPADQRAILRMHLLDRASIDEIAALHTVHRATAARWITRIRERLAAQTHQALQTALALDDHRLESLMRAVDSRLDLSLSRLLTVAPDDGIDSSES